MTPAEQTICDARRWMFHREELPPRGTRPLTVAERERLFGWVCGYVSSQDRKGEDDETGEDELEDIIDALAGELKLDPDAALVLYKAATS